MIKVKKSLLIYRSAIDVAAEFEWLIFSDKKLNKYLKKEAIRSLKVPKNTLKILFKDKWNGFNGDGFARNVKTHIFTYNVLTFKR